MSETERSLVEQEWFHGVLPREEVVRLLRADGDYLVRETTRNHARQLVLSVCWGQHKHFIVQTTPEVCLFIYIIGVLAVIKEPKITQNTWNVV